MRNYLDTFEHLCDRNKRKTEFSRLSASCAEKQQAQGWVWTVADASPPVLLSNVGHNCNYIKVRLEPHARINHPPTAHLSWIFSPARQPCGADIHSIPLVFLHEVLFDCKRCSDDLIVNVKPDKRQNSLTRSTLQIFIFTQFGAILVRKWVCGYIIHFFPRL